ncbi:MAG: serine/threonine-protein kinase [Polyangiaceae bacterium]
MSWNPGDLVSPHVRLVRPLSAGSMGQVWVAHDDRRAGRAASVAVKFIAETSEAGEDFQVRFAHEARAGMRVQSPHVVRILDHGLGWDGMPFIVMELCEGETLRAKMDRLGLLDMSDIVDVTHQIAEGLAAAHAVGVIHRDVKPDNIMLERASAADRGDDGHHRRGAAPERTVAKLFDFGIAKHVAAEAEQSVTQANVLVGSLAYMSPEQLLDAKEAQVSFDAWGLAVTAYEALTAALPFSSRSVAALLMAHAARKFPLPSEAGMARAFDHLFARAFARDPADRPDPRAFAAELRIAAHAG